MPMNQQKKKPKKPKISIQDAIEIAEDFGNIITVKRVSTGDVIRMSAKLFNLFYKDAGEVEPIGKADAKAENK